MSQSMQHAHERADNVTPFPDRNGQMSRHARSVARSAQRARALERSRVKATLSIVTEDAGVPPVAQPLGAGVVVGGVGAREAKSRLVMTPRGAVALGVTIGVAVLPLIRAWVFVLSWVFPIPFPLR